MFHLNIIVYIYCHNNIVKILALGYIKHFNAQNSEVLMGVEYDTNSISSFPLISLE